MEPKKVGRTLGIGVRVASNMLRERVERASAAQSGPVETGNGRPAAPATPRPGIKIDSKVAGAKRGAKAFGQSLSGPIHPRWRHSLAGDHWVVFCAFCTFFCAKCVPGPERLEPRAGTCPPAAVCRSSGWLCLVFLQFVPACVPQKQARGSVADQAAPLGQVAGPVRQAQAADWSTMVAPFTS